jgi:acetyl esterase/lipase
MRAAARFTLSLLILTGCGQAETQPFARPAPASKKQVSLPEARRGFTTKLVRREVGHTPVRRPPDGVAEIVRYDSPAGPLAAYLTADPRDGRKHPAIVWITGGDCNTIDISSFQPAPADDDQTAGAFRRAGIVTLYPSLRGGNDSPAPKEGFFGEVDDVLAAADFLARQSFVDPQRIYLGGHSTGGTLALLVAESSGRFRAVFASGPVGDVRGYGSDLLPFERTEQEMRLRAPIRWLASIKTPVFVFEGTGRPSNIGPLNEMAHATTNPWIHFHPVPRANHFSVLFPLTELIAAKILQDAGPATNIYFNEKDIDGLFGGK